MTEPHRTTTGRRVLACYVALTAALTGCAGALPRPPPAAEYSVGGMRVATQSAEMQTIVFQSPDDVEKFCRAPSPDAAPVISRAISLGASGESVGRQVSDGAAVLGGRGQALLVTRELLYRACEFALNYRLDKQEALTLYQDTLDRIERIAPHLRPDTADGSSGGADDDGDGNDGDNKLLPGPPKTK